MCESGLNVIFTLNDIPGYTYTIFSFRCYSQLVFTLYHEYPWNGNRNIGGRNLKCVHKVRTKFALVLHVQRTVWVRKKEEYCRIPSICYFSTSIRAFSSSELQFAWTLPITNLRNTFDIEWWYWFLRLEINETVFIL